MADTCTFGWCPKPLYEAGLCGTHYSHRRYGTRGRALRDITTWGGAHQRVRRYWGSASQYVCVTCGDPAYDWAYDGTVPSQKCGPAAVAKGRNVGFHYFSSWPEFYMPMCRKCHGTKDGEANRAEMREWRELKQETGLTVRQIRDLILGEQ